MGKSTGIYEVFIKNLVAGLNSSPLKNNMGANSINILPITIVLLCSYLVIWLSNNIIIHNDT